jgi:hypothetical protein
VLAVKPACVQRLGRWHGGNSSVTLGNDSAQLASWRVGSVRSGRRGHGRNAVASVSRRHGHLGEWVGIAQRHGHSGASVRWK